MSSSIRVTLHKVEKSGETGESWSEIVISEEAADAPTENAGIKIAEVANAITEKLNNK